MNFTDWEPTRDWLVIKKNILPQTTESKIIVPESARETNSGVVMRCVELWGDFMSQEVFWPKHAEIDVFDTDTKNTLTLVKAEAIIMHRKAKSQPEFFEVTEAPSISMRPFETQPKVK